MPLATSLKAKNLVLLSGGLDSAANLALSVWNGDATEAIHCCYGQKAEERELEASRQLTRHFGVALHALDLRWLGGLSSSALTSSEVPIPTLSSDVLNMRNVTERSANAVWVPNRNGLFIMAAAAFAEARNIGTVLVGFNREEAATFPDNSKDFLVAINQALKWSTRGQVRCDSWTVDLDKRAIVQKLRAREFPWDFLWSCYGAGPARCGTCESCQRLARAMAGGAL